jgi:ribosomal protein S18 acetylase RimI-like enzyme
MVAAFAELAETLPVASGAHSETVEDVLGVMAQGGAVLCFADEEAIGSARYRLEDADTMYVGRVAVLPAQRRRGVASAMMRFLEDLAASLGRRRVLIGVRDSLPSNIRLYQSLGYELVSVDPHPRGPDKVWTMIKRV